MAGGDTTDLVLGALAGILVVAVGYGATIGDADPLVLGAGVAGLLAVLGIAVARRARREAE